MEDLGCKFALPTQASSAQLMAQAEPISRSQLNGQPMPWAISVRANWLNKKMLKAAIKLLVEAANLLPFIAALYW